MSRTRRILPTLFFLQTGVVAIFSAPAEGPGVHIGAVNCQTSGCHGGAGDLSRQHTIWFRADRHSRAHATLTTARSARMAEALGMENAATDVRCTSCHAPFALVPASQKLATARPEEGVSCESCHGASGGWVRSHTRPDYTRAQRVAAGMRDLEDLYLRSNTCVACHQALAPELIAAGHPRLHFDQAGLSDREPRHWKEIWSDSQLWAVGQFAALRELSGHLAQKAAGGAKPTPEELADWESTLALCRLIAQAAPWGGPSAGLEGQSSPSLDLARAADALAKQGAKAAWKKEWPGAIRGALETAARPAAGPSPALKAKIQTALHSLE